MFDYNHCVYFLLYSTVTVSVVYIQFAMYDLFCAQVGFTQYFYYYSGLGRLRQSSHLNGTRKRICAKEKSDEIPVDHQEQLYN